MSSIKNLQEKKRFIVYSISIWVLYIVGTWVGLRPLIYEAGKKASELSRKDEIFYSKSGLVSIAGGKLTGYRKMSEKVVALLDLNQRPSD